MTKEQELINELQEYLDIEDTSGIDLYQEEVQMCIDALETKIELNKRNMTPDIIKAYMIFEDECIQKNFTFRSLIEAREKQIAKKVTDFNEVQEDSFYHLSFMCPNCNQAVISQPYRPNYCKHCGQRLDWSEAV